MSYAGNKDSQNFAHILSQTIQNLSLHHIPVEQITADAGYSSGEALAFCEDHHIDAYIPNFGQYKAKREGFDYHPLLNQYQCKKKEGNFAILTFKGIKTDSKGYQKKSYRSSETDCKDCLLRLTCCGVATKFKKIEDSIDKPYYDRMHQKLKANPQYAKAISKIRSRTVEPVLGTLINFMNLKRLNTRGMISANKHVLMSAMAYNLKKLMKFSRPKIKYHTLSVDVFKLNQHIKLNFLIPLYLNWNEPFKDLLFLQTIKQQRK